MINNNLLGILTDVLNSPIIQKDKRVLAFANGLSRSLIKLSEDKLQAVVNKLNTVPLAERSSVFDGLMYVLTKPITVVGGIKKGPQELFASDPTNVFWALVVALEINKPENAEYKTLFFPTSTQFLDEATPSVIIDAFKAYEALNYETIAKRMGVDPTSTECSKTIKNGFTVIYNILTDNKDVDKGEVKQRAIDSEPKFKDALIKAKAEGSVIGISPIHDSVINQMHTYVVGTVKNDFLKNTSALESFNLDGVEEFASLVTLLLTLIEITRIGKGKRVYERQFERLIQKLDLSIKQNFGIEWSSLRSLKPIVTQELKFVFQKTTPVKEITPEEYERWFTLGLEQGVANFEKHKKTTPNIDNILNNNINPTIANFKKEFFNLVVTNKNALGITENNFIEFVKSCYMAVALKCINYKDEYEIDSLVKTMSLMFKEWKSLPSLRILMGHFQYRMGAEKAEEIYKILNPQIITNITNALSKNSQNLSQFLADLKSGKLTNIYEFCEKYPQLGIVTSAQITMASYVLDKLSNADVYKCVRLILQRIEAENSFAQTGKMPDNVESLKTIKRVEELQSEVKPPIPEQKNIAPNTELWAHPETIKIAGSFLYQLWNIINDIDR